ncbi:phosphoribosylformylglycinamidine synthase subunit PurL [Ferroplasma acidiphilum]|uniref:phosphoribosylformylglycinamidine synthase subunit PurL n=1 Tax=Ferroplasma acidiphilum TaxID=74969 RepID=UPI0023EFF2ED|nr:phosphoribosylformylglycinamidine synthase subunit PurL [Ferroplasma acidiphilum]
MYDIIKSSNENLGKIAGELGLTYDEIVMLRNYFTGLGRNPTDIEIQAIAQGWSEHSCYKSSKLYLKKYFSGLKSDYTILTMEDDAGVISFDKDYAYVVKMESHNHPSAVEPYGGAATGVGGIIRDVLCMGAQPVALVDSLYFGDPDNMDGNLTERFILNRVVAGIRDYGNRVGIPTVAGSTHFNKVYNGMPLVNAGCIGIVRKDHVVRSRVSVEGDLLIVCGGRTGKDGIHGVNFASKVLDKGSEENRNAVQLGNPIIKEPLIHAILEANEESIIDGMKDLGGGGLSSAVSEMLFAGGMSGIINLDKVLLKDSHMEPWEIWVSESQERMFLAIKPSNLQKISRIFEKWGIEYSIIGETVKNENLVINFNGEKILDMKLSFLTGGPMYARSYKKPELEEKTVLDREPENYRDFIIKFLSNPNICSRFNIVRQYDFTVRGNTIVKPFAGFPNHETHSDAPIIKPVEESYQGLCLTSGSIPEMVGIEPYKGTMHVLSEGYRNILSSGGKPHSIVDALNFGNPENPQTMYRFIESIHAISDFCKATGLPLVSGNVSFYNETDIEILPTPNMLLIGKIEDVRKAKTVEAKTPGNPIYLAGSIINDLAGSQYSSIMGTVHTKLPDLDIDELVNINKDLSDSMDYIESMHDISTGGLLMAILEMSFGGPYGIDADISDIHGRTNEKLFSELGTGILIEVRKSDEKDFLEAFSRSNIRKIGTVIDGEVKISENGRYILSAKSEKLRSIWEKGLDKYI